MWSTFRNRLYRWRAQRYWRRIEGLLVPNGPMQGAWRGLQLQNVSGRLKIQWRARDLHPWARDLPLERKAAALAEQSLADTEAAIGRLFEALPDVDEIDLSVLAPSSESIIMAGTVERGCLPGVQRTVSLRMRLLELGVRYRLNGTRLEALGE